MDKPADEAMTDSPLLAALRGMTPPTPPIWLMRQAGRYLPEYRAVRQEAGSFISLCLTPRHTIEVTLQPIRRFGLDAAILFSDILIVPHGLGRNLRVEEGIGPQLDPVRSASGLGELTLDGMVGRLGAVYEAVAGIRAALPRDVALIGFAGSPWTVATYMVEGAGSRDFLETKRWAYGDRVGFGRLLDILVEATVAHLSAQVKAGADVVMLFDSWAGAVPAPCFEEFVIAPTRSIVSALKSEWPDLPVIGFPRGAGVGYASFAEATGVDAVALDPSVPLAWAADRLQPLVAVQGSVDPVALVTGGEALRSQAAACMAAFSGGRFIFNLGHGILPMTPPEHVADLVALVRGGAAGAG